MKFNEHDPVFICLLEVLTISEVLLYKAQSAGYLLYGGDSVPNMSPQIITCML